MIIQNRIGEYDVIQKIGQGGMGEVYKAVHTKLGQTVAIKMLSSEYSEDESMKRRFLNEARIQAKFTHPNVVTILNFFEHNNHAYLVMEYINGETLESVLRRRGMLQLEEALEISYTVIGALVFMHSKGVIHRDIKPSNIMFTEDGVVKVTDFGIAKSLNEKTRHTKTGIVGSVDYVSPEQILGEETNKATDIYSFGITLYKMLTGNTPFKGDTEYSIMRSRLEDKPVPPNAYNPVIPKSVNKVILKSISRQPRDRYRSFVVFSQELRSASKKDDKKRMQINLPDIGRFRPLLDSFFRTSFKTFLIIVGVSLIVLIIKFIPTISLMYLYVKKFFIELYLSVLK